jgi:isopenicillin-N N-acyltransferase-like protein
MKRRDFLKISAVTPLYFYGFLPKNLKAQDAYTPAGPKNFEMLEISQAGSYREIGYQIGKRMGRNIRAAIECQKDWHNNLLELLESEKGKLLSVELKRITRKYFPQYFEEIEGMADGSGIAFPAIWAMCIKAELGATASDEPGCSSLFYNKNGKKWLFHNEDGNMAYKDLMFIVKVRPPSGISFLSMVYPGILTGNGPSLNDRGIVQTTNYIGSVRAETGLPKYVIGRAILEAGNLEEAVQIATMSPRAFPYHHHLASFAEKEYRSVETTPEHFQVNAPEGIYCHTNHLVLEKTRNFPYEDQQYKNTSSMSRYTILQKKIKNESTGKDLAPGLFLQMLSSHQNAPYSPCRHPEGDVTGQTLGTAFVDINNGIFRIYKGNPCQSVENELFREYSFS